MVFHMSDVFNSVYKLNVLLILVCWSINEYNSHNLLFLPHNRWLKALIQFFYESDL